MITPGAGYKVDPNNPNGVVPVDSLVTRYAPAPLTGTVQTPSGASVNATTGADVPPAPGSNVPGSVLSPLQLAENNYMSSLPTGAVDENAIREGVRKNMQGQIDSVNAYYQNLTATQTDENNKQYGRVRGINQNSGLGGSDFASANATDAENKGNDALARIEQQKSAAVATILGNIDSRATDEINTANANRQSGLKESVDILQARQNGARDDVKTLAQSGVTLDQLAPEQYQNLLKQSGYDDFTFKAIYNNSRPAAAKIDYQYKTVGNKLFGYGIDPLTGQLSTVETDLPGDVPQNYKPQVLDNGTIVFYPDQIDPSKPIKDQIVTYNTGVVKDTRTEGQKNDAETSKRVAPAATAVAKLRDPQSGYVDPQAYKDLYQTYLEQNPGKGKEFLDQFPVSIYIDPSARSTFSTNY